MHKPAVAMELHVLKADVPFIRVNPIQNVANVIPQTATTIRHVLSAGWLHCWKVEDRHDCAESDNRGHSISGRASRNVASVMPHTEAKLTGPQNNVLRIVPRHVIMYESSRRIRNMASGFLLTGSKDDNNNKTVLVVVIQLLFKAACDYRRSSARCQAPPSPPKHPLHLSHCPKHCTFSSYSQGPP